VTSTHIIRRQFLDVEFDGDESGALVLQNQLLALCRNELGLALEYVFDRLAPVMDHWTIDRLDIEAGLLQPQDLERLIETVAQEVKRQLLGRASARGTSPAESLPGWEARAASARRTSPAESHPQSTLIIEGKTESQSAQQAFLYFLETGVLPWWFQLSPGSTLEEVIRGVWQRDNAGEGRPASFARLLSETIRSASMRKRLVRQFSGEFLATLLHAMSRDAGDAVGEIFAELGKRGIAEQSLPQFFEQVWESAFVRALTGGRATAATLVTELVEALPSETKQQHLFLFEQMAAIWPCIGEGGAHPKDNLLAGEWTEEATPRAPSSRKSSDQAASRLDLEEGLFVNCAGMVLLHPFLPRFFEGLGIAQKDKLLQPERALCLLHFLATGLRFAPEYDLSIAKVLCDVPLELTVSSRLELTAAEEEEAAALLAAVLRHWDALGDTSVENLRGSFLVRPGKLSQRDGEYVLQVETRSYDILLDRLPWGLGLIQLPWMQRILWVEWRF